MDVLSNVKIAVEIEKKERMITQLKNNTTYMQIIISNQLKTIEYYEKTLKEIIYLGGGEDMIVAKRIAGKALHQAHRHNKQ